MLLDLSISLSILCFPSLLFFSTWRCFDTYVRNGRFFFRDDWGRELSALNLVESLASVVALLFGWVMEVEWMDGWMMDGMDGWMDG